MPLKRCDWCGNEQGSSKCEEAAILDSNKYLDRYVKCFACQELHLPENTEEHEISESRWAVVCKPCVETLELGAGK
jgi:hypothetical protein